VGMGTREFVITLMGVYALAVSPSSGRGMKEFIAILGRLFQGPVIETGFDARCGECPEGDRPMVGLLYLSHTEIPALNAPGFSRAIRAKHTAGVRGRLRIEGPPQDVANGLSVSCRRGHHLLVRQHDRPDARGVVYLFSGTTAAPRDS
jgi:hypothetical protein